MSTNAINQTIITALFILYIVGRKYFEAGFRILLIKLGVIRKEDGRSCAEMAGYSIGKLIGKIAIRK